MDKEIYGELARFRMIWIRNRSTLARALRNILRPKFLKNHDDRSTNRSRATIREATFQQASDLRIVINREKSCSTRDTMPTLERPTATILTRYPRHANDSVPARTLHVRGYNRRQGNCTTVKVAPLTRSRE